MEKRTQKMGKLKRLEAVTGYCMIAPLMIGVLIFYVITFIQNFYDSFTNKSSFGKPNFIGLQNYSKLFHDPQFYQALLNTVLYVIICVPIVVVLAVVLAVLLDKKIPGKGIYRTLIFLPAVTLPAAIALLWKWLLNYKFGIVNEILGGMNINAVAWLSDPKVVLISISFVFIWSSIAYQMIILLAGLQGISKSYYEASELDGASPIQSFLNITLPMLSPSIFFVAITTIINVFQIFDIIYLMIPQSSSGSAASSSLVTYFFQVAFIQFHKGYGAAVTMVLFVLILIVTVIQLIMQKKWVYYDE